MDKITEKIINLLSEITGADPEELNSRTPLTEEYSIEPIDLAKLIIECEYRFHIKIYDEHVYEFKVIDDLTQYIERRLEE